jgi:hypothetical protein
MLVLYACVVFLFYVERLLDLLSNSSAASAFAHTRAASGHPLASLFLTPTSSLHSQQLRHHRYYLAFPKSILIFKKP